MATAKLYGTLQSISGTIGGITFVALHGRQVLRRAQKHPRRSPGQQIQPERLKQAAAYWRSVLADPAKKAFYLSRPHESGMGAYQHAVRDFLRAPVIETIDVTGYSGKAGDNVWVEARDDTAVVQVAVEITDMQGVRLEAGVATAELTGPGWWRYAVVCALSSGRTVTIKASAADLPGNRATRSVLAYVG